MNVARPQRFDEPLDVEDIPEFHASRLLLLLLICGTGKRKSIEGRLKLAKLDFFVRYPSFLERGLKALREEQGARSINAYHAGVEGVEASMVRYRYGPWDHRYYDLISMLEARTLIRVGASRSGVETYWLTSKGLELAQEIAGNDAFGPIVERCKIVSDAFGRMKGTHLRDFIYSNFSEEVTKQRSGAVIAPESLQEERHS